MLVYSIEGDPPPAVSITLDGVANDGTAGENDNVQVDDVIASAFATDPEFGPGGSVTLVGGVGSDSLAVGAGHGNITGGPGNDILSGSDAEDTIDARDGFADRVRCLGGDDTVIADTLDTISGTCESLRIADVGNAGEDRPPTILFTAPAAVARLKTRTPTMLMANAADDRGISKVQFLADNRIICEDAVAPYTCAYQPRGEDVGRNTLAATAIDTSQQTATAVLTSTIRRFAPINVSISVKPRRDRSVPFRFRSTGRISLPATVSPAVGCAEGSVSIQIKARLRTISNRRVELNSDCTFTGRAAFRHPERFPRNGRLRITAHFHGNDILSAARSRSMTVRAGERSGPRLRRGRTVNGTRSAHWDVDRRAAVEVLDFLIEDEGRRVAFHNVRLGGLENRAHRRDSRSTYDRDTHRRRPPASHRRSAARGSGVTDRVLPRSWHPS